MVVKKKTAKKVSRKKQDDSTERVLAGVSYVVWIVALISFFLSEDKPRLRYHSINALGFAVAVFLAQFVAGFALFFMGGLVYVIWIIAIVFGVMYGLKAYNEEKVEIPVITDLLKQNVKRFRWPTQK
jgi:uncharacterized membrane protein